VQGSGRHGYHRPSLHDVTKGNPLYVREMIRALALDGVAAGDGARAVAEISVPSLEERGRGRT
jgi:predicted ATPase